MRKCHIHSSPQFTTTYIRRISSQLRRLTLLQATHHRWGKCLNNLLRWHLLTTVTNSRHCISKQPNVLAGSGLQLWISSKALSRLPYNEWQVIWIQVSLFDYSPALLTIHHLLTGTSILLRILDGEAVGIRGTAISSEHLRMARWDSRNGIDWR